ncbi:hypothetical protein [Kribbella sp. NPDC055071]
MSSTQPDDAAKRSGNRITLLFFVAAVSFAVTGAVAGERLAGLLGAAVGHSELALRAIGWCWGGLPWVVLSTAIVLHHRALLTSGVRTGLKYVLPIWVGSAAFLLPGRTSSLERRFGSAWPDARPLGFGWGCGAATVAAMLLVVIITGVILKKLPGQRTKRGLGALGVGAAVVWAALTAAGLIAALAAPLP